ncbi:MAG: molybdopterin-dependent oxidoreductase [Methanobacteriaceae archaeon]|jgi:formate dehydrogenase major subunit|nr:molybdopterin-dependent oxidoreductase [Methanobacteriaceae archaeon]
MFVKKSICPSCSVGCGINLVCNNDEIVGTYPYKRHPINEGKNCLRGRDSYKKAIENRILTPYINENSKLEESDLDSAINKIVEIIKNNSPEDIAIISSGDSTNEENKIISEFAKAYGINKSGFLSGNVIKYEGDIASYDDLNNADFIFVIGDVVKENPLIGRRIMIAKDNGAEIFTCDTKELSTSSLNSNKHFTLESISDLIENFPDEVKNKFKENSVIVFNKLESKEELNDLAKIASENNSKILPVLKDCNTYGSMDYLDPLSEEDLKKLLSEIKNLILINEDISSCLEDNNLESVIYIGDNFNETSSKSDIVLPICSWLEKEGSFTNTEGLTQNFYKIKNPPENVLEEIELLKLIGEKLDITLNVGD